MKCPCCGTDIEAPEFMWSGRRVYVNGKPYQLEFALAEILIELTTGPVILKPSETRYRSRVQGLYRLRRWLRDLKLPYVIDKKLGRNGTYTLRKLDDVQNNHDAERKEDVYSRSGVHYIRR